MQHQLFREGLLPEDVGHLMRSLTASAPDKRKDKEQRWKPWLNKMLSPAEGDKQASKQVAALFKASVKHDSSILSLIASVWKE